MELLKAILIGIIQGLTEFLPVSSSGHIEIAKAFLGFDLEENQNLLFTLVLHTATALSTVVIYRKEIGELVTNLFKAEKEALSFGYKIVISMLPAAAVGFFFKEPIEDIFSGNLLLVGCMLGVTAVLLLLADRAKNTEKEVGFVHALLIGISQAIAILPGISRSGATISTSVLLGIDRAKAAFFSFLMVIPLIFGAMAKDLLDKSEALSIESLNWSELGLGFIAAFVSGLFACKWMIALVKKAQLKYFSYYCLLMGAIAVAYHLW